jgi:hypothetical protein
LLIGVEKPSTLKEVFHVKNQNKWKKIVIFEYNSLTCKKIIKRVPLK